MNESIRNGFEIVSSRNLPTMDGEAVQIRHPASGARILHIRCPEAENCFCVAVPTPPPDDTGMPHILEHMTLAGSEKFPCKEPFFEMIKRSVATFINALTGNDMTYYPVCSTVKADLFNLADVYFDAVFHPLLSDRTFAREAFHLAPADPAAPTGALRWDGIVYSEMKGVFSSPEGILERDSIRKLLPDTCHGRESGGNPESIPDLTLDALRQFHAEVCTLAPRPDILIPKLQEVIQTDAEPERVQKHFLSRRLGSAAKQKAGTLRHRPIGTNDCVLCLQ